MAGEAARRIEGGVLVGWALQNIERNLLTATPFFLLEYADQTVCCLLIEVSCKFHWLS